MSTEREVAKCEICGEPMPEGESMFKYHGYSGDCPKEPLPRPAVPADPAARIQALERRNAALAEALREMYLSAEGTAERSFRAWDGNAWIWTDAIWRDADPDGFARATRARAALAANKAPQ